MSMPAVRPRRWTAAEVRRLIDEQPLKTPRYELVDGELLVTPSPAPLHQRAIAELAFEIQSYLREFPVGILLIAPSDVELEVETVLQPDLFVVPSGDWPRYRTERVIRRLLLAVEVISPSSGRYDRVVKRPVYQRNVPGYWVVDLDSRLIERWLPGDSRPELLTETIEWLPADAVRPFVLELPAYFKRVFGADE
jgi:Uma2 family endonuclease